MTILSCVVLAWASEFFDENLDQVLLLRGACVLQEALKLIFPQTVLALGVSLSSIVSIP